MISSKTSNQVKILGIPLYSKDIPKAVENLIHISKKPSSLNYCISLTGAHGTVYAQRSEKFKAILLSFYMNLPDGMPSVWLAKLKGAREIKSCNGSDFFSETFKSTVHLEIKHFLCGGQYGVAEKLKLVCEEKFHNKNVVGTYCPPFLAVEDYDYQSIADQINSTKADIVWIGLSTPKQEVFSYNLAKYTNVKFIIAVGAAFDFHTGKLKLTPKFLQKMGLEWFYRLCMEPKRLWRRYLEIVPKFIYFNILDFLKIKNY